MQKTKVKAPYYFSAWSSCHLITIDCPMCRRIMLADYCHYWFRKLQTIFDSLKSMLFCYGWHVTLCWTVWNSNYASHPYDSIFVICAARCYSFSTLWMCNHFLHWRSHSLRLIEEGWWGLSLRFSYFLCYHSRGLLRVFIYPECCVIIAMNASCSIPRIIFVTCLAKSDACYISSSECCILPDGVCMVRRW